MKKSLLEQLQRMHRLNYGSKVINESKFVDNILQKVGLKKVDDPTKADLVSSDVGQFFNNLESINEPLTQQNYGGMVYQKNVETVQMGLTLLGYELPVHGVDGLFGPETARAVVKFKKDHDIAPINEEVDLVRLSSTSYANVKYDNDGTKNDTVHRPLLDDLQRVGEMTDIVLTITVAKAGHNRNTKYGNLSRHTSHVAVDIEIFNGVRCGACSQSNPRAVPKFQDLGNKLADALENLGYKRNGERGTDRAFLWQTTRGGNHYDHIHVSNKTGVSEKEILYLANLKAGADFDGVVPADFDYKPSEGGKKSFTPEVVTVEMVKKMIELLKSKNIKSEDLSQLVDAVVTGGGVGFTDLDLTKEEDFNKYARICQEFIDERKPNLLGITGEMLATEARNAFIKYNKFVPAELALAQLAAEGGIGNRKKNSRPIKTNNPFNVGNTDKPYKDNFRPSVQDGIKIYYELIARSYLGNGKTATDLVQNFVNKQGYRYAGPKYEKTVRILADKAHKIAGRIV